MTQFGQFIINHWPLFVALIIVLLLIFINELQTQKHRAKELSPQALVQLMNDNKAIIIDLRDAESFNKGHIINAIRATAEDFTANRMDKYKDKPVVLVCARGLQSGPLAATLRKQGFTQPLVLTGGIAAWQNADLPLVKGR